VEDVLRKYLAREWAARRCQPPKRGEALFGKGGECFTRRRLFCELTLKCCRRPRCFLLRLGTSAGELL
jgi:hypothetical protein